MPRCTAYAEDISNNRCKYYNNDVVDAYPNLNKTSTLFTMKQPKLATLPDVTIPVGVKRIADLN
jgi:hypothetical protein